MFKEKTMMFLYGETPIHPGAGSGSGFIDLPIQRERFTGLPVFHASGVKGAMRQFFEFQNPAPKNEIFEVFGPDTARAAENAGALGVGEAKILLFPVKSLYGVFGYLTCPLVLQRFKRDLEMIRYNLTSWPTEIPSPSGDTVFVISTQGGTGTIIAQESGGRLMSVFDEFGFSAVNSPDARIIAEFIRDSCLPNTGEYSLWRNQLPSRFAIVPDDVFIDFTKLATEVQFRNRIDDNTRTVAEGALWTEELLPSETVLYSLLLSTDPFTDSAKRVLANATDVLNFVKLGQNKRGLTVSGVADQHLQAGGDQNLCRGFFMTRFLL